MDSYHSLVAHDYNSLRFFNNSRCVAPRIALPFHKSYGLRKRGSYRTEGEALIEHQERNCRCYQNLTQKAQSILQLREQHHLLLTGRENIPATRAQALRFLDCLLQRPILTIRAAEKHLSCAFVMAHKVVERLVRRGLLEEITGAQRNRLYRYTPNLPLFDPVRPTNPACLSNQGYSDAGNA